MCVLTNYLAFMHSGAHHQATPARTFWQGEEEWRADFLNHLGDRKAQFSVKSIMD